MSMFPAGALSLSAPAHGKLTVVNSSAVLQRSDMYLKKITQMHCRKMMKRTCSCNDFVPEVFGELHSGAGETTGSSGVFCCTKHLQPARRTRKTRARAHRRRAVLRRYQCPKCYFELQREKLQRWLVEPCETKRDFFLGWSAAALLRASC